MKRKSTIKLLTAALAIAIACGCAACADTIDTNDPTGAENAPTTIVEEKTALLKITADNATDVFNNNRNVTAEGFVAYEDFELEALDATTNGYTGNAVKFTQSVPYRNGEFCFNMPVLTDDQKADFVEKYTHVQFWFAVRIAYGGYGTFSYGLLKDADGYGAENLVGNGQWKCVTMPIEDFFAAVEGDATPCLLASYASDDDRVYYFGDIELIDMNG